MKSQHFRIPKSRMAIAAAIFAAAMLTDGDIQRLVETGRLTPSAEAVIGRPLTPGSVAGVARRTTRRTVRRSAVYAATLPRGCVTVVINGVTTYQCGATYYQAYGTQYVVVYVQ